MTFRKVEVKTIAPKAAGVGQGASGIWAQIASASEFKNGDYIKPGRYHFKVIKLLLERKRKGICFIAELDVLKAEATEPGKSPNAGKASFVVNMTNDTAPGNVKSFIKALTGLTEEAFSEKLTYGEYCKMGYESTVRADVPPDTSMAALFEHDMSEAVGESQPFAGMEVGAFAFTKEKKTKPGEFFTAIDWESVVEDIPF